MFIAGFISSDIGNVSKGTNLLLICKCTQICKYVYILIIVNYNVN